MNIEKDNEKRLQDKRNGKLLIFSVGFVRVCVQRHRCYNNPFTSTMACLEKDYSCNNLTGLIED